MSEPLLQRFTNFDLYTGAKESWLVSNPLDRGEQSFFREVFARCGPEPSGWERRGAYYIDDGDACQFWDQAIAGTRVSVELAAADLPPVERPERHERTIPVAIHPPTARSMKGPADRLLHADVRRR